MWSPPTVPHLAKRGKVGVAYAFYRRMRVCTGIHTCGPGFIVPVLAGEFCAPTAGCFGS